VILSIGANIGKIEDNFMYCINELQRENLKNLKCSRVYKNKAFGCPDGTPDFFNAAISGLTNKSPEDLLLLCKNIEIKCGRPEKHSKWTSRTLDVDIVFYDELIVKSKRLEIPHREALKRLFVLYPIFEIEPDFLIPTLEKITIAEYLEKYFSPLEVESFSKNAVSFQISLDLSE